MRADAWPGVRPEVAAALSAVLPASRVSSVQRIGCAAVKSYSTHWTCLFPQHGPGKKHERPIVLEQWQQEIVDAHPGPFLRGLIHSDGCRMTNWARQSVAGEMKRYEYPRYYLSNKSLDILAVCCAALDRLGVAYRQPRWDQVSVARREAVTALDDTPILPTLYELTARAMRAMPESFPTPGIVDPTPRFRYVTSPHSRLLTHPVPGESSRPRAEELPRRAKG